MRHKLTKYIILALLCIFIVLFLCRNIFLRSAVDKKLRAAESKFSLLTGYSKLKFSGLTTVSMDKFYIMPNNGDTLLTLNTIDVKVAFWPLITGRVVIKNIFLDKLNVNFVKKDSTANYDFLFKPSDKGNIIANNNPTNSTKNFARSTNRILNLIYGLLPKNGELTNILIIEKKDSNFVSLSIPLFSISDGKFNNNIFILEDGISQEITTLGEFNNSDNTLLVDVFSTKGINITLPYVKRRFGATVAFDTLACSLVKTKESGSLLNLNGEVQVSGLNIYHKAVSPQTVTLDNGHISYNVHVGENYIEMDSISFVQVNKLKFNPYVRAVDNMGEWHFTVKLNKDWFNSMDLFESLPSGLFNNLERIKTEGMLSYNFFLDLDMSNLDSLKLEQELKQKDFRIVDYGVGELLKLNSEFIYTAYERGEPVRSFAVGPSHKYFTPLDSISPILQMSVLQSEDGEFFYHNGFRLDAIRDAIIYDIKERRFARGGSTISMQLVKNIYLNRNKNFARKLEEALLVWLIESKRLTSKQRMFEVYLNIIEWGPGVYGVGEASNFYFNKLPSQLTVEESIFMASIIPKPKYYRNSFNDSGALKENLSGYFSNIAQRLARKGLITQTQADTIRPKVELKIKEIVVGK